MGRVLWPLAIGLGMFFLLMGLSGKVRPAALRPLSQGVLAQGPPLTHTVYLPLVAVPPPPPCAPHLRERGLQLADLATGFTLEFEAGGLDLLSAEVRAMGAQDICSMAYTSFLWLLLGEMGVVGSMVIEFDNSAGPGQYLAWGRAEAVADPATTLLPDVPMLGQEMVATRVELEGDLAVYMLTFRQGRFVARVAGGGLVDLGVGDLWRYGEGVEGRLR